MLTMVERVNGLGTLINSNSLQQTYLQPSFTSNAALRQAVVQDLSSRTAAAVPAPAMSVPQSADMLPLAAASVAGFALGAAGMVALLRRRAARGR